MGYCQMNTGVGIHFSVILQMVVVRGKEELTIITIMILAGGEREIQKI